jgi:hypothetical protein
MGWYWWDRFIFRWTRRVDVCRAYHGRRYRRTRRISGVHRDYRDVDGQRVCEGWNEVLDFPDS